ncbi:uncharacterized protein [Heterodontus francisci]|uniref:uncharacterized protein n=1 Tax=Heterodontus francisci TaxID=7792 RepID=UPI00355C8C60
MELREMDKVLNEYVSSVFTVQKVMEGSEFKRGNTDILNRINIKKEEVLEVSKLIKFCSLHDRKDVIKLWRVQKRFRRMIPGLEGLSHSLGDTDPGSEIPEGNSSSIEGLLPGDYDDVQTGAIDTQDGHLLLDSGPDDLFTLTSASGDLSTLVYSSQTRTEPALLVPSNLEDNEDVHCDRYTIADIPPTMGSDCLVKHFMSTSTH